MIFWNWHHLRPRPSEDHFTRTHKDPFPIDFFLMNHRFSKDCFVSQHFIILCQIFSNGPKTIQKCYMGHTRVLKIIYGNLRVGLIPIQPIRTGILKCDDGGNFGKLILEFFPKCKQMIRNTERFWQAENLSRRLPTGDCKYLSDE